jgi:hypothetical protein
LAVLPAYRVATPVLERLATDASGVVLGAGATAAWVELDGFVVAVTTREVPLLPNAVALAAAGGAPRHLVSLHVYTTEVDVYRARLAELGAAYRRHLGRHYVATALFEVAGLFDPAAKVELVGIAVVPDPEPEEQP